MTVSPDSECVLRIAILLLIQLLTLIILDTLAKNGTKIRSSIYSNLFIEFSPYPSFKQRRPHAYFQQIKTILF